MPTLGARLPAWPHSDSSERDGAIGSRSTISGRAAISWSPEIGVMARPRRTTMVKNVLPESCSARSFVERNRRAISVIARARNHLQANRSLAFRFELVPRTVFPVRHASLIQIG